MARGLSTFDFFVSGRECVFTALFRGDAQCYEGGDYQGNSINETVRSW